MTYHYDSQRVGDDVDAAPLDAVFIARQRVVRLEWGVGAGLITAGEGQSADLPLHK